jgi:transcriptional regulator with XRE-family HTH domain
MTRGKTAAAPGLLVNLEAARTGKGLSQAQVAGLIDKTASHYSKIERGVIGLDARDALALCDVFGLGLHELMETRKVID